MLWLEFVLDYGIIDKGVTLLTSIRFLMSGSSAEGNLSPYAIEDAMLVAKRII